MSQIFVLLILNPVIFSKLFIKQIYLSQFSLKWMIGILLALQGMSDERRPVCEKTLWWSMDTRNTCSENPISSCQQLYAASETDLHTTVSRNTYHLRCRRRELVLQKAAAHKQQPIKHFRRGFTVLENLEETCPSQLMSMLPTLSHCTLTAVKRSSFHVLGSLPKGIKVYCAV